RLHGYLQWTADHARGHEIQQHDHGHASCHSEGNHIVTQQISIARELISVSSSRYGPVPWLEERVNGHLLSWLRITELLVLPVVTNDPFALVQHLLHEAKTVGIGNMQHRPTFQLRMHG